MNKFQRIKFGSVEEFLEYLPERELQIVNQLRNLVKLTFPSYREELAYNIPFYYNHRRICFIWPAAVPWGSITQGVALGFVHGHKLDPKKELLEFETRKNVGRLIFSTVQDVMAEEEAIRFLLQEAYLLDSNS